MVHANRLMIQVNKHAIHRPHRRSCCFVALVDVRHPTSSALKDIKVGQVPKSRRCSSERHKLSAAWAMRRPWRVFTRVSVAHGRKRSLNRYVVRSRPTAALAHQCGNGELTNEQKNWNRICVFGDDRHRDDLPRRWTCIGKLYTWRSGSMPKWYCVLRGMPTRS